MSLTFAGCYTQFTTRGVFITSRCNLRKQCEFRLPWNLGFKVIAVVVSSKPTQHGQWHHRQCHQHYRWHPHHHTPLATPTPTTAPSQASTEMPVDQSSKRDGEEDPGPEESRAKWHRGQGKGAQQNQRAKGRPQQQQSWWEKDRSDKHDNKIYSKHDDLKQAVKALGRLVLRQEDSLAVMQLDCQFIIFMKNSATRQAPSRFQTGA